VPGDSAPGNGLAPVTAIPLILIENCDAFALPPFTFTTCLITIRWPGWSSFVIVQVFVSPFAIVPEQSEPIVFV